VARLLKDAGIVRNRLVIAAAITAAQRFLDVRKEFGTLAASMWSWVKGKPSVRHFRTLEDYSPYIDEAVVWGKDLKRRGIKFLGPTVVYAHMQAVGMVNDYTVDCFRRATRKT
jgi:DNA-3-methyladenine glycosylase I